MFWVTKWELLCFLVLFYFGFKQVSETVFQGVTEAGTMTFGWFLDLCLSICSPMGLGATERGWQSWEGGMAWESFKLSVNLELLVVFLVCYLIEETCLWSLVDLHKPLVTQLRREQKTPIFKFTVLLVPLPLNKTIQQCWGDYQTEQSSLSKCLSH